MESKTTETSSVTSTKLEWKKPEIIAFDTKKTHGGAVFDDETATSRAS